MDRNPTISVLMSVYNGQPYLAEAIESILSQTYTDFEFIIIDDCSDDGSSGVIEEYAAKDKRIKLITNKERLGLGANLRKGVEIASGEWIARMDADDISMPYRFEKQLAYAEENPEIDIIGSYAFDINENGEVIGTRRCPTSNESIRKFVWACPIIHPTAFLKKKSILRAGSYGFEKRRQDYALWFRCVKAGLNFANMPEPLLKYRFTQDYFRRNNVRALLSQIKIGWKGCWLVRAEPIAYLGVTAPLTKALFPESCQMFIAGMLKKFDPRNK